MDSLLASVRARCTTVIAFLGSANVSPPSYSRKERPGHGGNRAQRSAQTEARVRRDRHLVHPPAWDQQSSVARKRAVKGQPFRIASCLDHEEAHDLNGNLMYPLFDSRTQLSKVFA
jgi:hypothetical protein